MVDFATAQQMANRSSGAIPSDHPYLTTALAAASRLIRNECGWHIATAETLTVKSRSRHWGEIWIPAMQITAVTITTLDGVGHVLADDEFDPETGWTSWSGDRYTIEYTAGHTAIPADLTELTLQIVARSLGGLAPLGITREQSGGVSVTYSPPGFAEGERDKLAAYKLGRLP